MKNWSCPVDQLPSAMASDVYSKEVAAETVRACSSASMAAAMVIGEARKEERKRRRERKGRGEG